MSVCFHTFARRINTQKRAHYKCRQIKSPLTHPHMIKRKRLLSGQKRKRTKQNIVSTILSHEVAIRTCYGSYTFGISVSTFSPIYPRIPQTAAYNNLALGPVSRKSRAYRANISVFGDKCFSTDKPKSSSS